MRLLFLARAINNLWLEEETDGHCAVYTCVMRIRNDSKTARYWSIILPKYENIPKVSEYFETGGIDVSIVSPYHSVSLMSPAIPEFPILRIVSRILEYPWLPSRTIAPIVGAMLSYRLERARVTRNCFVTRSRKFNPRPETPCTFRVHSESRTLSSSS